MAYHQMGRASGIVFPPPNRNGMVTPMAHIDSVELDILPDGSRENAVTVTVEVEFHFNPAQPGSDLHPPLPPEPATVDIIRMRVKKEAPKNSPSQVDQEWETTPGWLVGVVGEVLLGRHENGD